MRTWRVLLRIPFLALVLLAILAPPVSATSTPSAPRNIQLSVAGDTKLELRYDAPSDDGGDRIRGYRIRVSGQIFQVGRSRNLEVRNLRNGVYSVEVSAFNRHGWGPWAVSNEVRLGPDPAPPTTTTTTTTKPAESKPSKVRSLKSSVDDDGNIRLEWKKPSNGSVDGYVVRVAPNFERRLKSNERSTTLSGFNPGSYEIFVSAFNGSGESQSATISATVEGPPEVRVGPFRNASEFVDQQYRDLFGREADAEGRAFWASRLAADGSNAPQIIDSMTGAPEFQPSYQSIRLYLAYFNRLPDNPGLNYWVDILKQNRASLGEVSEAFSGSQEFRNTYGSLSDRDFVALVYNNVLVRRPDQAGLTYWVRQLALGLSRGEMMILFSDSAEFVTNSNPAVQTAAIYNSMLDRSPSAEEFQKWLAHIGANPDDRLSLIEEIFASNAYRNRIT